MSQDNDTDRPGVSNATLLADKPYTSNATLMANLSTEKVFDAERDPVTQTMERHSFEVSDPEDQVQRRLKQRHVQMYT